ncbi:MAG: SemiSWEET transporter [Rickettsiales bacterium]|nr:SemiSWEET transporter [Pseudomonadota bacterium]MDA0966526.1 SemiSWEET transporter [Pseudomonadota bacterium]MDG4543388.1 SemiSWEET transporter [Rickettsiales bacterium]MDG4545654.1 SemiSWEET transporter [Rickettsiales bacterium]MDG4548103.1 SemiSWEET transporter [Rickettsiales bacterium]
MEDLIGIIAATCTTGSFVPQVIKIFKTKNTRDLSLSMYVLFTVGVSMWLIYGFMIDSLPVILANSVTLCLTSLVLFMKLREK